MATLKYANGAIVVDTSTGEIALGSPLSLAETTTPTPTTDYGKLYPKADNRLYFQDGAGVEHQLAAASSEYASMFFDANSTATVIETADTPIGLRLLSSGSLDDWTFNAGSTGAITAYADGTGKVNVTSGTHGLLTGDFITIRGTTNYNGVWEITKINNDSFSIQDTWVADDGASDWDQASYLQAGADSTGEYSVGFTVSSAESGGAGSTILYIPYKNDTVISEARIQRKFSNNDVGAVAGGGDVAVVAGDRIYMTVRSSGTNNITNSYGNVHLERL